MAWATYACQGEWDAYGWPASVKNRGEYSDVEARKRNVKDAVKEQLREGSESLLK